MGNRAIVHFENDNENHGIYLHWNGGPESVLAFIAVMTERQWLRIDYASARFAAVVGEFFDADGDDNSGTSLGVFDDSKCGAGDDNGLYEVTQDKAGQYKVKQRGKAISYAKLTKDGKVTHDGIVALLRELRSLRKLAAQKRLTK